MTKLFAVVALGVAGGCEESNARSPVDTTPAAIAPQPAPPPAQATVKPRTLPDGRPACGNVMTKAPRPEDCK